MNCFNLPHLGSFTSTHEAIYVAMICYYKGKTCNLNLTLCNVQGGMVEALGIYKKWNGYSVNYEGLQSLVFSLKEPNSCCLVRNNAIRISIEPRNASNKGWDFEVRGYFPDRSCSIVDVRGNVIAQVSNYASLYINILIYFVNYVRCVSYCKLMLHIFYFYE